MGRQYGITPTKNHCTCMVDLLGRARQLDEALALASAMPVPPSAAVWHTLMAACQTWNNVEAGRRAFDEAVKLDEKDAAACVLLSKIYTSAEMGEQAQTIQAKITENRAWKLPEQSWWTDEKGPVHRFLVGQHEKQARWGGEGASSFQTKQAAAYVRGPAAVSAYRERGSGFEYAQQGSGLLTCSM